MMKNKSKYILKIFITVFLTLGVSISLQSILADWDGPSSAPPGDIEEVLDIGDDYQHKFGTMSLGGIGSTTQGFALQIDSGDVDVIDGRVGVGVDADGNYQLEIHADESAEGVRVISAPDWSPLNIRNSSDSSDIFRVDQSGDIVEGNTIYKDGDGNVIIKMGGNAVSPVCGNSVLEFSEDCDDGGAVGGDGCSATCQFETQIENCGNLPLPTNSVWNDGSQADGMFTQIWNGSNWNPLTKDINYNIIEGDCNYDCLPNTSTEGYVWVGDSCEMIICNAFSFWDGNSCVPLSSLPTVNFTADDTRVARNQDIDFTDISTSDGTIISWLWNFGDGDTSILKNPTHDYSSTGNYNVSLTVTDEFGTDTETKTNFIVVGDAPTANFTANKTTEYPNNGIQFTDTTITDGFISSWLWNFGDGNTSTSENPLHSYGVVGTYTVSLSVTDEFGTDTETKLNYLTIEDITILDGTIYAGIQAAEGAAIKYDSDLNTMWNTLPAGGSYSRAVAIDANGHFYAHHDQAVHKIDTAGTPTWSLPTDYQWIEKNALTVDSIGNIYVGTYDALLGDAIIQKISPTGTELWRISVQNDWSDITAIGGLMPIYSLATDGTYLYIGISINSQSYVRQVSLSDKSVGLTYTFPANTNFPYGMKYSNGNLFIGGYDHLLRKLPISSMTTPSWIFDAGSRINDLALDSSGNIYLACGSSLQKLSSNGTTVLWSEPLSVVVSLDVDPDGNIYIAMNDYVKKYSSSGDEIKSRHHYDYMTKIVCYPGP